MARSSRCASALPEINLRGTIDRLEALLEKMEEEK
jgi:hypothetical protein